MNFSAPGVWPFPGVSPIAGATAPNVKPPANAAPLLRNPLRLDFMGLSFAHELPRNAPCAESIGVFRNNSIRHEKGRTSQLVFVVRPSRQANDGNSRERRASSAFGTAIA